MTIEEINKRLAEIGNEINAEDADVDALSKEVEELEAKRNALKANAEKRAILAEKIARGAIGTVIEKGVVTDEEKRAIEFAKTGTTKRALLATGKIAKPSKAGGISPLAEANTELVDDVHSFALEGNGSWTVGYKKKHASAADVTDGAEIGGEGAQFDYVTINPDEVGVTDTVSNQVKKMTPVMYESEVVSSALYALRAKLTGKIVAAVKASELVEKVTLALDQNFLRDALIGFKALRNKGETILYISREDFSTLGRIRGTSEKKPLYSITYDPGTTLSGILTEGGLAVKFRILDELTKGTQLFGQPMTIDMPMWDDFEVKTDESQYFTKNQIAVRGLQTAGADLVVYHGMQIITQTVVAA